MITQPFIELREAQNKVFVHFTYAWHEKSIHERGLNTSTAGQMGKAIYCCDVEDVSAVNKAIEFMKDEINWRILAEHLGVEEVDDIDDSFDLDGVIVPVYFLYTGNYLYGTKGHPGIDIEGYVAIQVKNIPTSFLNIGSCLEDCDIDTQIEEIDIDFDFEQTFSATNEELIPTG